MFPVLSHLIQQSEASLRCSREVRSFTGHKEGNQLLGHLTQPSAPALFIPCPSSAQNHPLSSISEYLQKHFTGHLFPIHASSGAPGETLQLRIHSANTW